MGSQTPSIYLSIHACMHPSRHRNADWWMIRFRFSFSSVPVQFKFSAWKLWWRFDSIHFTSLWFAILILILNQSIYRLDLTFIWFDFDSALHCTHLWISDWITYRIGFGFVYLLLLSCCCLEESKQKSQQVVRSFWRWKRKRMGRREETDSIPIDSTNS